MTLTFLVLALLTIAGMTAAMALRNLVHCVLALTVGFVGLAALYLQLGAQFVGFTQILVYVGAVAILAVFVIMMTQASPIAIASSSWMSGLGIAAAVFAVLAFAIHSSSLSATGAPFHATGAPFNGRTLPVGWGSTDAPVQQIGLALMRRYVLPLEITALLLTAALIGAVVLAMQERRGPA